MKFKNVLIAIVMFVGAVALGVVVGNAAGGVQALSWLNKGVKFGFEPFTLDLSVLQFTLGFKFNMNIAQMIFLLIAVLTYKKVCNLLDNSK